MSKSKIEWCDRTWNPITGCTKISPGCENCYAERMAKRFGGSRGYADGEHFKVRTHEEKLLAPLRWNKPSKIFVGSMTDIFHDDVPDEFLDKMFAVMAMAANHTFMVLTKRPERMKAYFDYIDRDEAIGSEEMLMAEAMGENFKGKFRGPTHQRLPLSNVWLGVTTENQEQVEKRIPILLNTPAAYRFVSIEPMLSEVNLCFYSQFEHEDNEGFGVESMEGIDWVICGGESGHGARPLNSDWVLDLKVQCNAYRKPFFFKQWGEFNEWGEKVGKKEAGRLLYDEEVMEWPEILKPI